MTRRRPTPKPDEPKRGEIHLGDLAWALGTLPWRDDAQANAIARCLGFGADVGEPTQSHRSEVSDARQEDARTASPSRALPRAAAPDYPRQSPPIPLPTERRDAQLRAVGRVGPLDEPVPEWIDQLPDCISLSSEAPIARETLFPEAGSRHILSASLATYRSGAEMDVSALIERLARLQPLHSLPRRQEGTLDRGCQLLLDYGDSMVPFWEDLGALERQVAGVVGSHNIETYRFDGDPTHARRRVQRKPVAWAPRQRPVLVATGFGLLGADTAAELTPAWNALSERCQQDGSPLVILVPWPRRLWPRFAGAYPTLVHWSESTTVSMVLRKILARRSLRS